MRVESVDSEDWSFKVFGPKEGIKITGGIGDPSDHTSVYSLLTLSQDKARFAAAGSDGFVVEYTAKLREALAGKKTELANTTHVERDNITHIIMLASGAQLAVFSPGVIEIYNLGELADAASSLKPELSSSIHIPNGEAVFDARPFKHHSGFVFSTDKQSVYAIEPESDNKKIFKLKKLDASTTVFAINYSTDELVTPGSGIELPPSAGEIKWIGDLGNGQLAAVAVDSSYDENYLMFIQTGVSLDDWLLVDEACPPFGNTDAPFSWFTESISGWPQAGEDTIVAACSQSTDLLLLSKLLKISVIDDSDKLPFTTDDEDVVTVGSALDFDQTSNVISPIKGMGSAQGLPLLFLLTQEGRILAWHIVSRAAIAENAKLPQPIAAAASTIKEIHADNPGTASTPKTIADEDVEEISLQDTKGSSSEQEEKSTEEPLEEIEQFSGSAEPANKDDKSDSSDERTAKTEENFASETKRGESTQLGKSGFGFSSFAGKTTESPFGNAKFGSSWGSKDSSSESSFPAFASNSERLTSAWGSSQFGGTKPSIFGKPAELADTQKSTFNFNKSDETPVEKKSLFSPGKPAEPIGENKSPFSFGKPAEHSGKNKSPFGLGKPAEHSGDNKSPFGLGKPAEHSGENKSPFGFGKPAEPAGENMPSINSLGLEDQNDRMYTHSLAWGDKEDAENTGSDAETKAGPDPEAKAEFETKAKVESEAKAKAQAEADANTKSEAKNKAEAEAKAQVESEARTKADAEARNKADAEAQKSAKLSATVWTDKVQDDFLRISDVLSSYDFANLSDFDSIYAETNALFQAIDHNMQILEKKKEYTDTSAGSEDTDSSIVDIPGFIESRENLKGIGPSASATRDLHVHVRQLSDEAYRMGTESERLKREVELLNSEISEEAYYLRPMPLASAHRKTELQRKYSELYTRLSEAKKSALLLMVRHNKAIDTKNLIIAIDTVDGRLSSLKKRLERVLPTNEVEGTALSETPDLAALSITGNHAQRQSSHRPEITSEFYRERVSHAERFLGSLESRVVDTITSTVNF